MKWEMCIGAYVNGATTAIYIEDGQNNGNIRQYRLKLFVLAALKDH
jgi:hypothetical protein